MAPPIWAAPLWDHEDRGDYRKLAEHISRAAKARHRSAQEGIGGIPGKPITRRNSCSVAFPWKLNEDRTSQRSTALVPPPQTKAPKIEE
jgi:hypothetical protein